MSALRMSPLVTRFTHFWGRGNFAVSMPEEGSGWGAGSGWTFWETPPPEILNLCPGRLNLSLHCSLTKKEIELLLRQSNFSGLLLELR